MNISKSGGKIFMRKLSVKVPKGQKQNRQQAKKRNIVEMLKTLRAALHGDTSDCNPDSKTS